MIINNNLVWKFNKDNEFPKSVFRTNNRVVIRDKTDAYYFDDKIAPELSRELRVELDNSTQFAVKYTYVLSEDLYIGSGGSAIIPIFKFMIPSAPVIVKIYPYAIDSNDKIQLVHMYKDEAYGHLRELICSFGCDLVHSLSHEFKLQLPLVELKNNPEEKDSWFNSFTSLFSSSKKKESDEEIVLIKPDEREVLMYFNLNEIVTPLMNEHVYSKTLSKEDLNLLKSLTLVIHLG